MVNRLWVRANPPVCRCTHPRDLYKYRFFQNEYQRGHIKNSPSSDIYSSRTQDSYIDRFLEVINNHCITENGWLIFPPIFCILLNYNHLQNTLRCVVMAAFVQFSLELVSSIMENLMEPQPPPATRGSSCLDLR